MTPKQSNCMPPIIQIDATVEVQPPIVKPVYFRIMKTISAIQILLKVLKSQTSNHSDWFNTERSDSIKRKR